MLTDISVVIPTFRRPGPLNEAVRSALAQDGARVDVLVLDDSPEGSGHDVVAAIADPRVTYRHRAKPSGGNPSLVRNEGWPEARGQLVHFLDDDDRVARFAYREVLDTFSKHPDRGVVFGRIEPFGDDPAAVERERRVFERSARRSRFLQRLGCLGGRLSLAGLVAGQLFCNPTAFVNSACIIRREHIAALGGYDEQLKLMEDVDFFTRAIRAFGFVFLDRVLVQYRTGAPSLMNDVAEQNDVSSVYQAMYVRYSGEHGMAELLGLKLMGKAVVRWM